MVLLCGQLQFSSFQLRVGSTSMWVICPLLHKAIGFPGYLWPHMIAPIRQSLRGRSLRTRMAGI